MPSKQIDHGGGREGGRGGYRWLMGNGLRSSSCQIERIDIADTESGPFAPRGIGLQPLGFYSNAVAKILQTVKKKIYIYVAFLVTHLSV